MWKPGLLLKMLETKGVIKNTYNLLYNIIFCKIYLSLYNWFKQNDTKNF